MAVRSWTGGKSIDLDDPGQLVAGVDAKEEVHRVPGRPPQVNRVGAQAADDAESGTGGCTEDPDVIVTLRQVDDELLDVDESDSEAAAVDPVLSVTTMLSANSVPMSTSAVEAAAVLVDRDRRA